MLLLVFFLTVLIPCLSSQEILNYTIEEESPTNTFIADLSNELQIKTLASYKLFEIIPSNGNLFSIHNQTGYLTTKSILDREQLCSRQQCSCSSCKIAFQLIITTEQRTIYKIVEINVQDRNDHSPIFDDQSYIIYIKENAPLGYRIVLPIANDPDEGSNSIQSYRLSGMNFQDFDVDYTSIDVPYLTVRSSLDRQRISSYSLTLIASDNGQQPKPRSNSTQLDIRVTNDSIPIFLQNRYRIDVREDISIGTTLLKIEAISDHNQQIFYEILTESPFIIDRLTGNIQLKKLLDYEQEKSYRLIIKAYENIIPIYTVVLINVNDVNDNPVSIYMKVEGNKILKRIESDKNIFSIPEDTSVGTTLAHVIINDLDSSENGNPHLLLITNQAPFTFQPVYQNNFQNTQLYRLILQTKVDRETKSLYNNIQLIAHDSGTPTLHTRSSIVLNITDVNDCIPQLQTDSTIYNINENNAMGLIIGTLQAYDYDLGINGEFDYDLVNKTDLLVINSQTGQLILSQSIDFEKLNHQKNMTTVDLEFYVRVQDHGEIPLSSQTKIILRIHDLNDHAPQFYSNQSFNWNFSQVELQPNAVLGRIYAYDHDSGLQGIINYSIRSFDPCFKLDITLLGYVYMISQFSCTSLSYTFEITASDSDRLNARSTKKILTINIDSNPSGINMLPKLVPSLIGRTFVDVNSLGRISFIIDITHNQYIQPITYLSNARELMNWNLSSTGEVRLLSQPYASSYILCLDFIDEFTGENHSVRLQIDMCNSSIKNSCIQQASSAEHTRVHQVLFWWAIILALIITCVCVFIFSIITCVYCQRKPKDKKLFKNQQNFLQRNIQYESDSTFKTSSVSTSREDDQDSACVINTNSSSLSSGVTPIQINEWHHNQHDLSNIENCQPSTYFYDLKLAELIRNNQRPPCVYLNAQTYQSSSTDYGFPSSDISPSTISYSSAKLDQSNINSLEWNIEMDVDQSPQHQNNKKSYVSAHECMV